MSDRQILDENEYYHGTAHYNAIQILYEGFRLRKYYSQSGTFKRAIYLTKSLSIVDFFGLKYVFKCRLKKGISVLWLDRNYDPKVIQYLKKEFSKSILTEPISKVIPRNKKLTKTELIHLLNYRFSKARYWSKKNFRHWAANISSLREQLLLHKYDGVGELKSMEGLAIFNPSFVEPMELSKVVSVGEKTLLKPVNPKRFVAEINDLYSDLIEDYDEVRQEWENHISPMIKRYCRDHGLSCH